VRGASRGATGSTLAGGAAEHAPRVAAAGKGRGGMRKKVGFGGR
jgi:hypothetical protein